MPSKTKKRKTSSGAQRPAGPRAAAAKSATQQAVSTKTLTPPEPAAAVTSMPAAGPKPWILAVLGLIAVLVVVEMAVLLKGKADRQWELIASGTIGVRGGPARPETYGGNIALRVDPQFRVYLVDPDSPKVIAYDTKTGKFLGAITKVGPNGRGSVPGTWTATPRAGSSCSTASRRRSWSSRPSVNYCPVSRLPTPGPWPWTSKGMS